MAKELILVPKLKYDILQEKLTARVCEDSKLVDQTKVDDASDTNEKHEKTMIIPKKKQNGAGLVVSTKRVGRPPGKPQRPQKKIKWMTY